MFNIEWSTVQSPSIVMRADEAVRLALVDTDAGTRADLAIRGGAVVEGLELGICGRVRLTPRVAVTLAHADAPAEVTEWMQGGFALSRAAEYSLVGRRLSPAGKSAVELEQRFELCNTRFSVLQRARLLTGGQARIVCSVDIEVQGHARVEYLAPSRTATRISIEENGRRLLVVGGGMTVSTVSADSAPSHVVLVSDPTADLISRGGWTVRSVEIAVDQFETPDPG